ncbi:hypothetical protein C0Q70_13933 [Pomacea canaliculata]|uniref:Transferrin-like domain-containing protein n=1 Tax=Pomacea canaliculata TaxID=400727 RepID=A0A2T7NYQ1_POMCA|nr:hypothetical protein C0Q70_13933 [Pomacea canaliculata]
MSSRGTALCGLISALLVAVLCITEEDRRYCTKHLRQSETLEKDCETGASIALDPSGTRSFAGVSVLVLPRVLRSFHQADQN